jgi:hypothetical protein
MAFTIQGDIVLAEMSPQNPGLMAIKNLEALASKRMGATLSL